MSCPNSKDCSGCSFWDTPYEEQLENKSSILKKIGNAIGYTDEVKVHSLGPIELRDRADLQWRIGEGWGFLDKSYTKIKAINYCPLFSKPLQELFEWWSQFTLLAPKASVRLRVNIHGQWGVWLDLANIEVKRLLEQNELLSEWVSRAHVEIGQRFKVLKKIDLKWKLVDPVLKSWFSTIDSSGNIYSTFGSIGVFTQVGNSINQILVTRTLELIKNYSQKLKDPKSENKNERLTRVIELGAGAGNFTLALSAEGFNVVAIEQREEYLLGLKMALQEYPKLAPKIQTIIGNFNELNWGELGEEKSILFLDPPRSGIGESLLLQIPKGHFPLIFYISCSVESWQKDGKFLNQLGYQLSDLEWIDQFPNTSHIEILSIFQINTNSSLCE